MAKRNVLKLLVLVMFVTMATCQAAIITNGSFEAETFPNYGGATGPITGWTYSGSGYIGIYPSSTGSIVYGNSLPIPDGSQALFMQTTSTTTKSISQNVALSAGVLYTLSYYESVRSYSDQPYLTVTLGSQTLDSHVVYGPWGYSAYTLKNIDFTVPADGTYALSFTNDGSKRVISTAYGHDLNDATVLLDNIQIVPEPVSLVFMTLAGLFLRKRN